MQASSAFHQTLIRENSLDRDGFAGWLFCAGMLFLSRAAWWGDRGRRSSPHEGIDLLLYRNGAGTLLALGQQTRVPVLYDGTVVCMVKDFLGISVFVEHAFPDRDRPLISIYGHTLPFPHVQPGTRLKEGEIIGTLGGRSGSVRPHLHLSTGRVAHRTLCSGLDWKRVNDPEAFALIDPLPLLGGAYELVPAEEEASCLAALT